MPSFVTCWLMKCFSLVVSKDQKTVIQARTFSLANLSLRMYLVGLLCRCFWWTDMFWNASLTCCYFISPVYFLIRFAHLVASCSAGKCWSYGTARMDCAYCSTVIKSVVTFFYFMFLYTLLDVDYWLFFSLATVMIHCFTCLFESNQKYCCACFWEQSTTEQERNCSFYMEWNVSCH